MPRPENYFIFAITSKGIKQIFHFPAKGEFKDFISIPRKDYTYEEAYEIAVHDLGSI